MKRYTRPAPADPAKKAALQEAFRRTLDGMDAEQLGIVEALLLEVTTAKTSEQEAAAYERAEQRAESYHRRHAERE